MVDKTHPEEALTRQRACCIPTAALLYRRRIYVTQRAMMSRSDLNKTLKVYDCFIILKPGYSAQQQMRGADVLSIFLTNFSG